MNEPKVIHFFRLPGHEYVLRSSDAKLIFKRLPTFLKPFNGDYLFKRCNLSVMIPAVVRSSFRLSIVDAIGVQLTFDF